MGPVVVEAGLVKVFAAQLSIKKPMVEAVEGSACGLITVGVSTGGTGSLPPDDLLQAEPESNSMPRTSKLPVAELFVVFMIGIKKPAELQLRSYDRYPDLLKLTAAIW